ncbi:MAG: DUF4416 family protein [Actinobacteria bacterium]|nr:DUF4416 family protein [Actinomycetota bacterium]
MGQVKQVKFAKFIVGILAIDEELLPVARELITQHLGAIDICSPVWPFTSTKYYADEMSDTLCRQFVSLGQLSNPDRLVDLKLGSNCAELADAQSRGRGRRRAINLDPGYITLAKLVLATTKDYSHRVYLGRGVYGETTLHFHAGRWEAWPWTYPDYADATYHGFFSQVRERLSEQLRSQGQDNTHLE